MGRMSPEVVKVSYVGICARLSLCNQACNYPILHS